MKRPKRVNNQWKKTEGFLYFRRGYDFYEHGEYEKAER